MDVSFFIFKFTKEIPTAHPIRCSAYAYNAANSLLKQVVMLCGMNRLY